MCITNNEAKRALRTPCLRCLRWFVKAILASGVVVQYEVASAYCVCSEMWSRLILDSYCELLKNWILSVEGVRPELISGLVISMAEIDWLPSYQYDGSMTVMLQSSTRPELQ